MVRYTRKGLLKGEGNMGFLTGKTAIITGSIKLKCGYHHLTNWGTCSVFCIIGEKKLSPFYDADGNVTMRETLDQVNELMVATPFLK